MTHGIIRALYSIDGHECHVCTEKKQQKDTRCSIETEFYTIQEEDMPKKSQTIPMKQNHVRKF